MNERTEERRSGVARKLLHGLLRLTVAAILVYLVCWRHGEELLKNLRLVGLKGLLVLIGLAAGFQALDAAACMVLIRRRLPTLTFWQTTELMELGFFFQITTMSVGSIPAQGAYLHHRGLMVGDGLGLMAMNYILHKTAGLAAALLLLCAAGGYLTGADGVLRGMLLAGFLISGLLIGGLLLVCTCEPVHRLACRLLELLPKKEAWQRRKEKVLENLDALRAESRETWHHPDYLLGTLLLHILKHLWTAMIPVFCLWLLRIDVPPLQTMLLTALSLVVTGAIPNVAGMGPAEVSFLLLFSTCLEPAQAASALVLYRCATYFLPFLASILVSKMAVGRAQSQRKRLKPYEKTKKEHS